MSFIPRDAYCSTGCAEQAIVLVLPNQRMLLSTGLRCARVLLRSRGLSGNLPSQQMREALAGQSLPTLSSEDVEERNEVIRIAPSILMSVLRCHCVRGAR